MRFTSTTVVLSVIAAACAVPIGVDSSADTLAARDSSSLESLNARAETHKPTDAYIIPLEELAADKHHSSRSQTIEITYSAADPPYPESPAPEHNPTKSLSRVKSLLKAAESILGIKDVAIKATNEWKGSPNYVKFTFSGPAACKGVCKGAAYGSDIGSIHASDGKQLYDKERKA